MQRILEITPSGLSCPAGDFYIDPLKPVARAVITNAHSDHARVGSERYLAAIAGQHLLRSRLPNCDLRFAAYGETTSMGGVTISFHPTGHILGSAQIRLESRGQIATITGDYKLGDSDPTCHPWEPVPCHLLVSESTFALPVYRWRSQKTIFQGINAWWQRGKEAGKCSILYGYAIGKSQRLLAGLDQSIGPIYTHSAVEKGNESCRASGVALPDTTHVGSLTSKHDWRGAMVVAAPSAHGSPWLRRFGNRQTAMASGWMAIRGTRRRRATDTGFVLSDHVDWPTFLQAIECCEPEEVWVTHGYSHAAARQL